MIHAPDYEQWVEEEC